MALGSADVSVGVGFGVASIEFRAFEVRILPGVNSMCNTGDIFLRPEVFTRNVSLTGHRELLTFGET